MVMTKMSVFLSPLVAGQVGGGGKVGRTWEAWKTWATQGVLRLTAPEHRLHSFCGPLICQTSTEYFPAYTTPRELQEEKDLTLSLKILWIDAKTRYVQNQQSYTEDNVGQRSANKSLQARSSSHLCFKIRGFGKPAYIFIHLYLVYQLQSWLDTAETILIVEDNNTHYLAFFRSLSTPGICFREINIQLWVSKGRLHVGGDI